MKKLNTPQFMDLVYTGKTVLVDFYADWCGPCKMLTPVLEDLSSEMKDVEFVKVDVDAERELAGQLRITSLPTVALFKDGKAVSGFIGFRPKEQVKDFVENHK